MSSTTRRQRKLRDKRLGRNRHRARKPGTVRSSRMPGGPGFRGWTQWNAHHHSWTMVEV